MDFLNNMDKEMQQKIADYFNKGMAYFDDYKYELALENLRAALKLKDIPELRALIKSIEEAAEANAKKTYYEELASQYRR